MIELHNVSRWYGQVLGVNDITCTIGPGLTAMLGMNGAGKSTLLRMITGQLRPSTGIIQVFDQEPFANPEVFKRLGYCPEIDNFVESMSGLDFVVYMARLAGMKKSLAIEKSKHVVEVVGMADRSAKPIGSYSKGMRQRIKLAQAMVHNPDIILLDEPLNGLDPVGRHEFLGVLGGLVAEGKTVVVCSHILYEVEQMTRSILLLHRGRLLANGDLSVIREMIERFPHKLDIESPKARELAAELMRHPGVLSATVDDRRFVVQVETRNPQQLIDLLPEIVIDKQIPLLSFTSPDDNLESVFGYLVGEAGR